jgi:hemoglobin-like flavoprotein
MNPSAETVAPADRDLILASVQSQKMELDQFVSLFYAKFFERCPDTRPMFPHDMSLQEEKLLMSLTHIIEALEHPAKLRLILLDQGERHKALQINDDHFAGFIDSFTGALKDTLQEDWSEETRQAWLRFLQYVAYQMGFLK